MIAAESFWTDASICGVNSCRLALKTADGEPNASKRVCCSRGPMPGTRLNSESVEIEILTGCIRHDTTFGTDGWDGQSRESMVGGSRRLLGARYRQGLRENRADIIFSDAVNQLNVSDPRR